MTARAIVLDANILVRAVLGSRVSELRALASSPEAEDRELAQSIVQCARFLHGLRYKPPEKQPQRELSGDGAR